MIRIAWLGACRLAGQHFTTPILRQIPKANVFSYRPISTVLTNQSTLVVKSVFPNCSQNQPLLSLVPHLTPLLLQPPLRSVTKFSLKKGKRKSVKAALKRFMRLDWGGWIRTRSGRHKKMWKKPSDLKRRLRQHVLVNSTQSWLLDKMATKFWRKPKYYVDDPYRPYHSREEFPTTRRTPIKYE